MIPVEPVEPTDPVEPTEPTEPIDPVPVDPIPDPVSNNEEEEEEEKDPIIVDGFDTTSCQIYFVEQFADDKCYTPEVMPL